MSNESLNTSKSAVLILELLRNETTNPVEQTQEITKNLGCDNENFKSSPLPSDILAFSSNSKDIAVSGHFLPQGRIATPTKGGTGYYLEKAIHFTIGKKDKITQFYFAINEGIPFAIIVHNYTINVLTHKPENSLEFFQTFLVERLKEIEIR